MNNTYTGFVAAAVLLVVAVGFLITNTSSVSATPDKLQVGVLIPLTGTFPWWGENIRNGIKTAEAHGLTEGVEFVYADTQCDPKSAVTGTQRLKAQYPDMHIFIVGCDSYLKAITPILDPKEDIAFVAGLSAADVYETDVRIINLAYRLEVEAGAVADYAVSKLGVKKMGIIHGNNTFGTVLGAQIPVELAKRGALGVSEQIQINDTRPEVAVFKILAEKPDAIYIHNDIPVMVALTKRIREAGFTGEILAVYAAHDQSFIDAAGAAGEGVIVPWPVSGELNDTGKKFKDGYAAYAEGETFVTAYFVYDGLMLLNDARAECGADTNCIADHFFSEDSFEGTLGSVQYLPNGEVVRTFEFQKVQNGAFVSAE